MDSDTNENDLLPSTFVQFDNELNQILQVGSQDEINTKLRSFDWTDQNYWCIGNQTDPTEVINILIRMTRIWIKSVVQNDKICDMNCASAVVKLIEATKYHILHGYLEKALFHAVEQHNLQLFDNLVCTYGQYIIPISVVAFNTRSYPFHTLIEYICHCESELVTSFLIVLVKNSMTESYVRTAIIIKIFLTLSIAFSVNQGIDFLTAVEYDLDKLANILCFGSDHDSVLTNVCVCLMKSEVQYLTKMVKNHEHRIFKKMLVQWCLYTEDFYECISIEDFGDIFATLTKKDKNDSVSRAIGLGRTKFIVLIIWNLFK